jgi:hypothetical protein
VLSMIAHVARWRRLTISSATRSADRLSAPASLA